MEKLDLRKQLKSLYAPSAREVVIIDVPSFQFAMIDGEIEPGQKPGSSPAYQQALEALYGISFTLKFMSKLRKENPVDYGVMALEGLWWVESGEFDITRPDNWHWTAMIMQPEHITPGMFSEGLAQLPKKGTPAVEKLRLETFHEGLCVQILHVGPYSAEAATIARLHDSARQRGCSLRGKHHEIYLGDPRRADPAKLKTILRQPIEAGTVPG